MVKIKQPKAAEQPIGDVCLYGAQHCGHGWGSQTTDGKLHGTCDIARDAGATAALWAALDYLQSKGYRGNVRVFAPGGGRMAIASVDGFRPYFGDLKWGPAPVWILPIDELLALAE